MMDESWRSNTPKPYIDTSDPGRRELYAPDLSFRKPLDLEGSADDTASSPPLHLSEGRPYYFRMEHSSSSSSSLKLLSLTMTKVSFETKTETTVTFVGDETNPQLPPINMTEFFEPDPEEPVCLTDYVEGVHDYEKCQNALYPTCVGANQTNITYGSCYGYLYTEEEAIAIQQQQYEEENFQLLNSLQEQKYQQQVVPSQVLLVNTRGEADISIEQAIGSKTVTTRDVTTVTKLEEWSTTFDFSSPYGHGLSMEFFREISVTNGTLVDDLGDLQSQYSMHSSVDELDNERVAEVEVKVGFVNSKFDGGLVASCYPPENKNGTQQSLFAPADSCTFRYSWRETPIITDITPTTGAVGDIITITGEQFGTAASTFDITVGPATCVPTFANRTILLCELQVDAVAGTWDVEVRQNREGSALISALNDGPITYEVVMRVDDVLPKDISLYGGTAVTISGSGFANFGLYNKVVFHQPEWNLNVSCIPRVMRNFECQLSENDPGLECGPDFGFERIYHYDEGIHKRGYSQFFDFSNKTVIECDLERIEIPNPSKRNANAPLDGLNWTVSVQLASEEILADADMLESDLVDVMRSYECWLIGDKCKMFAENFFDEDVFFGDWYNFTGAESTLENAVNSNYGVTPVITEAMAYDTDMNPYMPYDNKTVYAMAGQILTLRGHGFTRAFLSTDENYYKNRFGFFDQRGAEEIFVGERPCRTIELNDTFAKCVLYFQREDVTDPIHLQTYGKGWAESDWQVMFGLDIYDISPKWGSVMGGTEVTITGSGELGFSSLNYFEFKTLTNNSIYYPHRFRPLCLGRPFEAKHRASRRVQHLLRF